MSDIAATADISADGNSTFASDGLGDTSNPTATETFSSESIGQESATPIESVFEIDGTPITLDEARNGYLRQSDYTRKTQELAEMRSRLAQAEALTAALEKNPTATLEALQEAFGMTAQAQQSQADPFLYENMDPEAARIAAIEARLEAQDQAARQAQIEAELNGLHEQFGQFDDNELFAHAIRNNHPNLKSAYADLHFDSIQQKLSAAEAKRAEEEARRDSARDAGVVHDGSTRTGATVPTEPQQYGSVRDAFLAAKKSLGLS